MTCNKLEAPGRRRNVLYLCYHSASDHRQYAAQLTSRADLVIKPGKILNERKNDFLTKGCWFFTKQTILVASSFSGRLSGSGGRRGSKSFCATVSWARSKAWEGKAETSQVIHTSRGQQLNTATQHSAGAGCRALHVG